MVKGEWGDVLRSVHALLDQGVLGNQSDGELLRRYASREGESAEAAFTVLVERHGARVLRVCRSTLRDEHEAQDAFQATFLVLARKASSIRVGDSLGPWLHGVAYRVSSCRRSAAARRRNHERKAAEQSLCAREDWIPDDLAAVLHDELNRLPERFREPMILCYLEGLTHEQAAERLRCPVGTVRSRLSTGRERMRRRLERRGIASSDGVLASVLGFAVLGTRVPAALVESTARMVIRGGAAVTVPSSVVVLVERGMKTMWLSRLSVLSLVLLAFGGGAIGTLALARRGRGAQEPAASTKPALNMPAAPAALAQATGRVDQPARRTILEARVEIARAILMAQERSFHSGAIGFEDVGHWSHRLMQDRLTLATTPPERQAAIREHRNRMLILDQRLDRLVKAGIVSSTTSMLAKYYRLEADQLLIEAGVDLSKEAPVPEPRPDAATPPPPPVPSRPR